MIDRRDLLKIGVAAPIALGLPAALRAAGADVELWVSDNRYRVFGLAAPGAGSRLVTDGDVTPLWTGTLDDAWRQRGCIVAGATGSDVLFVLEQLAWSRGRRVVDRVQIAPAVAGRPALLHWRIAPSHPSTKA